jgi:hypothetical protein
MWDPVRERSRSSGSGSPAGGSKDAVSDSGLTVAATATLIG